jgi:hypothetical protein
MSVTNEQAKLIEAVCHESFSDSVSARQNNNNNNDE